MNPETLRGRLRQVIGTRPSAGEGVASPRVEVEHDPSGVEHNASDVESILGGEWRDDESGRSFVVTRRYAADVQYGRSTVGAFARSLSATAHAAPLVGGQTADGPFVFFDLETTGLSGGAGTQAFIVGCAWFDADGSFVTAQHLLLAYAHERDLLRRAAGDVERGGSIVTFNGKSFDAPVIETRYLFHRLQSPCTSRPHIDLVHPARRFWGGVSPGCSLTTLEGEVLGVRRTGDVPGMEIPARYFHFVRSGDARPLAGVLEHNRLDLLSLAGLTAYLCQLVEDGPHSARHCVEALALGRTYERAGLEKQASGAYQDALRRMGGADQRIVPRDVARQIECESLRALALLARRGRRFDEAAGWWRRLSEAPGCTREMSREATEALAIHHEHRVRDLATAKMFALKSLEGGTTAAWGDAVRHRLARLDRKLLSERLPLFPFWTSPPSSETPTSEPRTSS